jgi:hypothetical protein
VKWSAFQTVLRDLGSLGVGSYMLVSQVNLAKDHPESVNFFLIAAGLVLFGVPGIVGVFQLRRGNNEPPDTPPPPSLPRSRASSRR